MSKTLNLLFNYKKIIIGFLVLLLILNSKTVYFGEINRKTSQLFFFIITFISFFILPINKKQLNNSFFKIIIFTVIFAINILLYGSEMENNQLNQVIGYILIFLFVSIFNSLVSRELFSKWYIIFLSLMCIISLPCVFIANFNPNLALSLCQPGYNWQTPFGYSFFYTWGVNGIINSRNSGMFWEPGAFQGFIILGILFLLFNTHDNQIKKVKEIFIIFVITLLTVQSSTGYFILIVILSMLNNRVRELFQGVNIKKYRNTLVVLFCGIILFLTLSSGNIEQKLFYDETGSTSTRFNDIFGGIDLILKGGLFGLGETYNRERMRLLYNVNSQDSVGLFAMTYTFGIIFSLVYILSFYKGINNFFKIKNYKEKVVLTLIFLLLYMTEGLWYLPVYLYFLFYKNN